MIKFGLEKSAGSVREVLFEFCGLPAAKTLFLLVELDLREVFAECLREVREVTTQVIDIVAGSLRAGSPIDTTYHIRWLFGPATEIEGI